MPVKKMPTREEDILAGKKDQDLCIIINLKGGEKNIGPNGQPGTALTQEFIKALQDEYATRFLDILKIEPTSNNKLKLL